jgi:CPA2 family monovalent cation:H+ antiporter-2
MHIFAALTLLILSAALLVWLFQRLRISPILAYLALGMALAPFEKELFGDRHVAEELAEIGVILLMFFLGLEFHLHRMRKFLRVVLLGGLLQVAGTAALTALLVRLLAIQPTEALLIGVIVAFSSTALVMRALEERGDTESYFGRLALGLLLFQDLAVILVLALLPLLAGGPSGGSAGWLAAGKVAGLLVVLPLLFFGCRWFLPWIFHHAAAAQSKEVFSLVSLSACFLVAFVTDYAGGSLALGAFMGGLVLCETPFATQVLSELSSLRDLALGFFFITIGLLIKVSDITSNLFMIVAVLFAVVLLKSLVTTASLVMQRVPQLAAVAVGLALAQVGEFSFVVTSEALRAGALQQSTSQTILVVSVLSMALTPLLIGGSARILKMRSREVTPAPVDEQLEDTALRAVVVGYGPVGRTLTTILTDFGVRPVIVDLNINTVRKLHKEKRTAIFGDAGRREVLLAAGIDKATYLLVTLPDLAGRMAVVGIARLINPKLKIITRAHYLGERSMLDDAGASRAAYEELEVSVALARLLLSEMGVREEDLDREEEKVRERLAAL